MDTMDKMLGKWKVVPECTENFDAFAAAMKFPTELIASIKEKEKNMTEELKRNGDVFSITSDIDGEVQNMTFQLGQQFTSKEFGLEIQNTVRVEGDVMVGEHVVCGHVTTSRRYLKDGQLVVENTAGNGVTTKSILKRC
ncbi:fatty acid-binding protein, heart-like [Babylonia areolata]|uniref:fatty acid-binding protein, heart-like n=1 Tax=Babylonia areolata TaxID=304850 RepID=UPI003FD16744